MQYTTQQVAEGFGVDERTVRRWAQKQGLQAQVRDLRGSLLFEHDDVVLWAHEHNLTFNTPQLKVN